VLYKNLGARRRLVHERIAEIVADPVTRARHLALATEKPDAAVAAALDDAVTIATGRGASASAAELAEAALQLTPGDDVGERHLRALAAARAHRASGEWTRARTIASALLEESGVGPLRAEVLFLLAELEGLDRAGALLEEALHEATSRPALQAAIQCRLAWSTRFKNGFVDALEHARASLDLADEVDDDALRVDALEMMAFVGSAVGDPQAAAYAARAHDSAVATGTLGWCSVPASFSFSARPWLRAATSLPHVHSSNANARSLASATIWRRPMHCTTSRGSSSGPAAGSSQPSTPIVATT